MSVLFLFECVKKDPIVQCISNLPAMQMRNISILVYIIWNLLSFFFLFLKSYKMTDNNVEPHKIILLLPSTI